MFGADPFLNGLVLTRLCVLLYNLVKLTELPLVWERAANSAYHRCYFVICLLRYVGPSFPLMYRRSFGFCFGQFLKHLYWFNSHQTWIVLVFIPLKISKFISSKLGRLEFPIIMTLK